MKIYEISEPTIDEIAIGIDLGTTNSLVAYKKEDITQIIPDSTGSRLMPSVVLYQGDQTIVGNAAIGKEGAIASIKRLIGQSDKEYPIRVSAEILKALKLQAEAALGQLISKAVITVPAYFDDVSRNATKMAAQMAGLEVLRLINEPTAAAVAYGLDVQDHGYFLIYDLGGGTFDISILTKQQGVLQVLAVAGDTELGGDDFDLALWKCISKEEISINDKILMRKIREHLTTAESWTGLIHEKQITITQEQFESSILLLVDKTIHLMKQAIKNAEIAKHDLKEIILVGGMTRTPLIRQKVAEFFGKEPLSSINPDEIVAIGAAIQAYALTHANSASLLLDVTPLTLGLEMMGGVVEQLISRNSTIPFAAKKTFTNYDKNQTGIKLNIVQGESHNAKDCRSLAKLEFRGFNPVEAGEARIEVTFIIDANGILTVTAKDALSDLQQEITVSPSYGLNEDVIINLLKNK